MAGLRWQKSEHWYLCGNRPGAPQGWKLYVPATPLNYSELLDRVVPLAAERALHLKYARDLKTLRKLNAGSFGYSQIGKSIVVYVESVDDEFVPDLMGALQPFRDSSPRVPLAREVDPGLPLFYRYGSFVDDKIRIGPEVRLDDRADAGAAIPDGVEDELKRFCAPAVENTELQSFLLKYPAFEALRQQGKCGIFKALDLASETYREIVLKVGYPNGQVQPDGSDGCDFLRRELWFYRQLQSRGLARYAPALIDGYDDGRTVVLVLEELKGVDLLSLFLTDELEIAHLEECWKTLQALHEGGLVIGDAKLANFMADEDRVCVLDFEAAQLADAESPVPIRTFHLGDPRPPDARSADRWHFLASVLFPYKDGRYDLEDRQIAVRRLAASDFEPGVREWAVRKLRSELAG